ncbi:MAG: heme peroxidase family protein [Rhodobacteraceae bacterium]|jgi:hypothetical protein|nr:heme peroxidase family protein [Paracoccaceae bacterium]
MPDDLHSFTSKSTLEPRHGEHMREMTRASVRALSGHGDPGKFGRMFPGLDPLETSEDKLFALAEAMKDPNPGNAAGDNAAIPAGFTYLGQFVDHDITLDLTPPDEQAVDPLATTNFRSPALDLDSLYGPGPSLAPHMYARDPANGFKIGAKLLVGRAHESFDPAGGTVPSLPNDLPRSNEGRAVIGDERNDENLLVNQTHLAFLKFHNAVVDHLGNGSGALKGGALLAEARRITTWHYQWIVLYDFIERLVGEGTIDRIRHEGRRFYRFKTRPYIPVEFAVAAYRLGHSMVRESYDHNRVFGPAGVAPGTLAFLFHFTGKSGGIVGDLAAQDVGGPGETMHFLPSNWVIDWRRFYEFGAVPPAGVTRNASRALDPLIVPALHTLPGEANREKVLPFRNLRRGLRLELPSGQDVAKAIGLKPLTGDELATDLGGGSDGTVLKEQKLHTATPLWYYILKEAQLVHGGARLGPVGATIIAECFLGFVHGDHDSFLWNRRNWKPELAPAGSDTFTMVDMLNFVNDINPLG